MKETARNKNNISFFFIAALMPMILLNFQWLLTSTTSNDSVKRLYNLLQPASLPLLILVLASAYFVFSSSRGATDNESPEKESRAHIIGLIILFAIGLALRLWNLTALDPYTDEYNHILGAKQFVADGHFEYTRAKLVTYSVAFFYWLGSPQTFYENLYFGRIPGAIFGALTIVPLYLLAKRISLNIAFIAALLWTISPWAIGISRTIREYAYYPFFVLIIVLLFIKLVDLIIDFKKENIGKIFLLGSTILYFLYYSFFIDNFSTLKLSFIIFPAIIVSYGITNARQIYLLAVNNKKLANIVLLAALLLGCFLVFVAIASGQVKLDSLKLKKQWFFVFMKPSVSRPMHWWHENGFYHISYLLLATGFIYAYIRKKSEYFLNLIIFIVFIIFFSYFFDRYFKPRYISYALPFFTILVASGIYSVHFLTKSVIKDKFISAVVVLLFVISICNPLNTIYPLSVNKYGLIASTGEYHDKVGGTVAFLQNKIKPGDYFITSIFINILEPNLGVKKNRIHHYVYTDKGRFRKVSDFIKGKPSGYMILDQRRNGIWVRGYPVEDFNIGRTRMRLILNRDGIHVYKWGKRPKSAKIKLPESRL